MKISQLAKLLDSIVDGLDGVITATHARDARTFREALAPFADESVAAFTAFLGMCEEYRRTGVVAAKPAPRARAAKTPADPNRTARLVESLQSLGAEAAQGQLTEARIDEALAPISKLTKPEIDQIVSAMNIPGRGKNKADAVKKLRIHLESQARTADSTRAVLQG